LVIKTIKMSDLSRELALAVTDIQKAQKVAVANGIIKYLPEIIKKSPVDTGLFAQSWDLIESERSIVLGNYAPHAAIVENGARPFTPPIAPLLAWAKRVLQDGSQEPNYSSRVWALAKYTQNKISRVGMEPKHILEDALPKIINQIKDELEAMQ